MLDKKKEYQLLSTLIEKDNFFPNLFQTFSKQIDTQQEEDLFQIIQTFRLGYEKTSAEWSEIQRWLFLLQDIRKYLYKRNFSSQIENIQNNVDFTKFLPKELFLMGIFAYLAREDIAALGSTNKYFSSLTNFFKKSPLYKSIKTSSPNYGLRPAVITHSLKYTPKFLTTLPSGQLVCASEHHLTSWFRNEDGSYNSTTKSTRLDYYSTQGLIALTSGEFVAYSSRSKQLYRTDEKGDFIYVQALDHIINGKINVLLVGTDIMISHTIGMDLKFWQRNQNGRFVKKQTFPNIRFIRVLSATELVVVEHFLGTGSLKILRQVENDQFEEKEVIKGYIEQIIVENSNKIITSFGSSSFWTWCRDENNNFIGKKHSIENPKDIKELKILPGGELLVAFSNKSDDEFSANNLNEGDIGWIYRENEEGNYVCVQELTERFVVDNLATLPTGEFVYPISGSLLFFRRDEKNIYQLFHELVVSDSASIHSLTVLPNGDLIVSLEQAFYVCRFPCLERKLNNIRAVFKENENSLAETPSLYHS